MTKKWLEKEAEEYAWKKLQRQRLFNQDDCEYSYIDGATDICKEILREVGEFWNNNCHFENNLTDTVIKQIIKNLGVNIDD